MNFDAVFAFMTTINTACNHFDGNFAAKMVGTYEIDRYQVINTVNKIIKSVRKFFGVNNSSHFIAMAFL